MIVCYPLKEIWPVVEPQLARLRGRYADLCDWTVESVRKALEDHRAFLFNSSEDRSFCIVKMQGESLFIWIACGENGKRNHNLEIVKEIARNSGAKAIEMETPRKGFVRMPGWRYLSERNGITRYRMEV